MPATQSKWQLPALTSEDVYTALRDCFDPEVKLNLVDLGLIFEFLLEPAEEGFL